MFTVFDFQCTPYHTLLYRIRRLQAGVFGVVLFFEKTGLFVLLDIEPQPLSVIYTIKYKVCINKHVYDIYIKGFYKYRFIIVEI